MLALKTQTLNPVFCTRCSPSPLHVGFQGWTPLSVASGEGHLEVGFGIQDPWPPSYPLDLQVPSEKVFGVGLEGPNTFLGGAWRCRDRG